MSTAKPHLAWVPNALTIGRIAFIPVLIGAILTYGTPKAFLSALPLFALFVVLILTDFLDGFFARRCWWILAPALVIIGRDIFVSGLREHVALEGIVMAPTQLAKWKTATEMAAIAALLVWLLAGQWLPISESIGQLVNGARTLGLILLWIAASLSAYTGLHYARSGLGQHKG